MQSHLFRYKGKSTSLDTKIVEDLQKILDEHNVLAKSFKMVKEAFKNDNLMNVSLQLIGKQSKDGRMYNLPTSKEVAILIVGDIKNLDRERDIIVKQKSGLLKRINELHLPYLGL